MRAIAEAVLALAPQPEGFTVTELAAKVRERQPAKASPYATRLAAYDLIKLQSKRLVERIDNTRRYRLPPAGFRTLAGGDSAREWPVPASRGSVDRQSRCIPSTSAMLTSNAKCIAHLKRLRSPLESPTL
ncbi:MAG: hypothetical protein ACREX4_25050 [Gammaproteobacteria bacterium]